VLLASLKVDAQKAYAALYDLAPFHPLVLQALAAYKRDAPLAELAGFYGPVAEYDLRVMSSMASAAGADTNAYRALYEKMAAIEPEKYFDLGSYLVDLDLDDEAAAAYEKGVEKARDRVLVSNSVRWLVGHYFDRSRVGRARELAEMAAGVYSGGGLRTMAYLMERLGRYDEAEQWYQKVVERYGESGQELLDEFYVRYDHRVGDGRFGGRTAAALARIFPEGLERVSISELTAPPPPGQGVRVSGRSHRTTQFGLMKDDVVVALNGYRVTTDPQYQLLWTFDDRPEATVIAWRRDRYVEVKGRLKRMAYGPATRSS
jgi:tetratricopeptide (TPR) repeat protein